MTALLDRVASGSAQDRALLTGAAPTADELARTATAAARAFFAAHRPD